MASWTSVDVVILTAIELEYAAVKLVDAGAVAGSRWVEDRHNGLPVASREFVGAGGRSVRVVASRAPDMGKASVLTTFVPLVDALRPSCIAMCGVCAGRPDKTALGDVVVAERLYDYDAGKWKGVGFEADVRTHSLRADWKVAAQRFEPQQRFASEPWWQRRPVPYEWQEAWVRRMLRDGVDDPMASPDARERCPQWSKVIESLWAAGEVERDTLELTKAGLRRAAGEAVKYPRFPDLSPAGDFMPFRVHVQPIGTGSAVREDIDVWAFLTPHMRSALGLEMEASALADIVRARAHRDPVDAVVMKGVMDFANHGRDDHFKDYAARASAECLIAFLRDHVEGRVAASSAVQRPDDASQQAQLAAASSGRSTLRSPYPGMRPYGADEAEHFYGRDGEIADILGRLRAGEREIYIIGPSGSGKSSLLAAGVLPRLSKGASGLGAFSIRSMRPGEHPATRLGELLAHRDPGSSMVAVVDQLEELFTLATADEQKRFLAMIATLRVERQCVLLLSLRADFYGDFIESPLWTDQRGRLSQIEVGPLRSATLRDVIAQPARNLGVAVEPELIERLLADAAGEPGILPLLQETLLELWDRRQGQALTLADYQSLGDADRSGLAVALSRRADATLRALTSEQESIARRILLRLVSFGEGRSDTRRQQPRSRLCAIDDDPAEFEHVMRRMVADRLLVIDDDDDHEPRVDLAHEVMIAAWPTLAGWIQSWRAAEQRRRHLELTATQWVRRGRGSGGLLDPSELAEVELWRRTDAAQELGETAEITELITASKLERDRLVDLQLARDLRVARQIQRNLLPERPPDVVGLSFAVHYEASRIGNDFYDFIWHDPTHLAIAIGDVAGHAISAALYMARLTSELRSRAAIARTPARLLHRVNQALAGLDDEGMFVTLVYCVYDVDDHSMVFTNAGHSIPLLRRGDRVFPLHSERAHTPPLGVLPELDAGEARVQLQPGDMLIMVSDGILQARDAGGTDYGLSRLSRRIRTTPGSIDEVVKAIVVDIDGHVGQSGPQRDDITIVGMSIDRPPPMTDTTG
jgi:serine phosphatase RsbU (regulator of sigma subunit)/nucleoside phosphorylase